MVTYEELKQELKELGYELYKPSELVLDDEANRVFSGLFIQLEAYEQLAVNNYALFKELDNTQVFAISMSSKKFVILEYSKQYSDREYNYILISIAPDMKRVSLGD